MAMRVGGSRRKSRKLLTKDCGTKGKISLKTYFQVLKEGEQVKLVTEPGIQRADFHTRFYGRVGTVSGRQGSCYKVQIMDGGKSKQLIVHPVHLQKV
jgi:large subunit ribosomal protein L21e